MASSQPSDSTRADDSLRIVGMREVLVQAESALARSATSVRPLTILPAAEIRASGARDAADALALAPGVFVRRYGGEGAMRSLSLRGTSAQQTLFLIDGERYQSSAAGAFDLGNVPARSLERLEVIRGGDAALYGANALGGVVNFVVTPGPRSGSDASLRIDGGSFGELSASLTASRANHRETMSASMEVTRTDGDYPFDFDEFGHTETVRRTNADYRNLFGRFSWSLWPSDDWHISATAIVFDADRGVPGAVVQGNHEQPRARLSERDMFGMARATLAAGDWQTSLAATGRFNHMRYSDPDATLNGPSGLDQDYQRVEAALDLKARRPIGDRALLTLVAEAATARLDGDNLDPAAGGSVRRHQWGTAASLGWDFGEEGDALRGSLDAALRFDGFSDLAPAASPSLGLIFSSAALPIRLRVHGAFNYRVPSFTEQYYLNFGNADLRPERSRSIDAGLSWNPLEGLLIEATAFDIDTRDQIVAVPRSPVSWSAQNVERVGSRGVELSVAGTLLDGLLAGSVSYTLMRSVEIVDRVPSGNLPYAPRELGSGYLEVRPGDWTVGANWQFASHRYSLPSNDPSSMLPAYLIVGARVSTRWKIGGVDVLGTAEAQNILDRDYQVIRNYPMPGRSARVGVEVGFHAD